jgi:predicted transcriptional regulator
MASKKTTVYLDADDYRRLKRIAQDKKCPPAQLVREAVAEYAARHAPHGRATSVGAFSSGGRNLSERAEHLLGGFGKAR